MSVDRSIRLLYMEDDPGLARLLQKSLGRIGYDVTVVADGMNGLACLAENTFDAALVDYEMPGLSGLEVIREIMSHESSPPVIMVTGNGNERIAVEALRLGAADYIVKDLEMGYLELLPMVLDKVLAKQCLIRERAQMFEAIQESEERYRKLVELSPDGIIIHHARTLEFVNSAGARLLGSAGRDALLGSSLVEVFHPDCREQIGAWLDRVETDGVSMNWVELKLQRPDGVTVDIEIASVPFTSRGRQAVLSIVRDISERNLAKMRLEQLAHFDPLTGLPNRVLFFDRLNHALNEARRYRYDVSLLFLDLDGFKPVNDQFGHAAGDAVLRETASRLSEIVRDCDTVARVGGDEFVVILSKVAGPADAELVASRIINTFERLFDLGCQSCSVGVSIGISSHPADGDDVDTLLKKADCAMYLAKGQGKNTYRFFCDQESLRIRVY